MLGGIDSPAGAVVGGLLLGVGLNLLGVYVDFIGADLRLPAALAVILVVLLVRPSGLFGRAVGEARMSAAAAPRRAARGVRWRSASRSP